MGKDYPRPRNGDEFDAEKLADNLEKIAQRLRDDESYLQGITTNHDAHHDSFSYVEVTMQFAAVPDVPLLDAPIYRDRGSE